MERTARQIADSFKIRASATIEICAGEIGLTDKQKETLDIYNKRISDFANGVPKAKDLTDKQKLDMFTLVYKRDNPELPEGAKTHCKKWLKDYLYKRREDLKNKYVAKGNESEEDGFTLMALQLNLGMVYKNTERRKNDFVEGECDLHHNRVTYDNKCSWSLDTFPMFEFDIPNDRYWWQLQSYDILWPSDELCLCYTLIDASIETFEKFVKWEPLHDARYKIANNMIFSKAQFDKAKDLFFNTSTKDSFIEIPESDRIKSFTFKPDKKAQALIEKRAHMCKDYIYELLIKMGYPQA